MARRAKITFAASLLACLFGGVAEAGDTADIRILGFSRDGATFAFEEYGIQDGSGFPYANRFYIDTATDRYRPGTPVRVRIDRDGESVADARAAAAAKGASVVTDAELAANAGHLAAWNALTELSAGGDRLDFRARPIFPPIDSALSLRLETYRLGDGASCHGLGEQKGFRLKLVPLDGGPERLLHDDKTVPASRGCPTGYRLAGVQSFFPEGAPSVMAVIVAVEKVGFEGPDWRWMAVTGRLD